MGERTHQRGGLRYLFLLLGWWQEGAMLVGPTEMLSARDRRDRPPEEGVAAELQGFAVDKNFLISLKGILLETELALTFIIFICFTASISAYMAAALLEFFITLAFLFLYTTQYYQRFDRLNWPCLDFLRCVSAIIIFLVVSFAAVTSRDGAAIAAFVSLALQDSSAPRELGLVLAHFLCQKPQPGPGVPTCISPHTLTQWPDGLFCHPHCSFHRFLASSWFPSLPMMPSKSTGLR
uniref:CKLF like MARVEL transmembrane domain containing 5 n=2 Tax=Callithrix jacchus TaxID=9483 RepID=A0A2R8MHV4_CALJA